MCPGHRPASTIEQRPSWQHSPAWPAGNPEPRSSFAEAPGELLTAACSSLQAVTQAHAFQPCTVAMMISACRSVHRAGPLGAPHAPALESPCGEWSHQVDAYITTAGVLLPVWRVSSAGHVARLLPTSACRCWPHENLDASAFPSFCVLTSSPHQCAPSAEFEPGLAS